MTWPGWVPWWVRSDLELWAWCEYRGQRRAEWAASYALVRWGGPAAWNIVQSTVWPTRWHALTDTLAGLGPQLLAWCYMAVLCWTLVITPPVALALAPAATVGLFGAGRYLYPKTTRGRVRTLFPPENFADIHDLRRALSPHAARQSALYTVPSLEAKVTPPGAGKPSEWLLARTPVTQCGTWLGRVAVGPPLPQSCWTSLENGIGTLAAPRKMKTASQTHRLLNAPGAAISTQTKRGTYDDAKAVRAEHAKSGTVHLLDPENQVPEEKSTFFWPCERGCADPHIAQSRAGAFAVAATTVDENGPFLAQQAATILQAFLLLADIIPGRDMRDVYTWCSSLQNADKAWKLMVSDEWRGQIPEGWANRVRGVMTNPATRTVGAIFVALEAAVGFMNDEDVAALCCPRIDPDTGCYLDPIFDVPSFLADQSTVFLIATDRETNKVGPLLSAFTDYVVEEAKQLAAAQPSGRLDPILFLSLDEVTNTIPMPLPKWMADTGGRGIQVDWSAQSYSQLIERWEEAGARTVWNATTVKIFAGGTSDPDDLARMSALCSKRLERVGDGWQKVANLDEGQLREIPKWHALLIHDDTRETIIRVTRPALRPDVIAAKFRAMVKPPPTLPEPPPALATSHRPALDAPSVPAYPGYTPTE